MNRKERMKTPLRITKIVYRPQKSRFENKEKVNETKRVLIQNIIAIILSPLSLVLGFYLSNRLQSPKLNIVYIDNQLTLLNRRLSDSTFSLLNNNLGAKTRLKEAIINEPHNTESYCTDWLDNQELFENCNPVILRSLNGLISSFNNETTNLKSNIVALEKWVSNAPPPSLIPLTSIDMNNVNFLLLNRKNKQQVINMFAGYLNSIQQSNYIYNQLLNELHYINSTSGGRKFYTGETQFNIGIINRGESDGLVFRDQASISFDNLNLPLSSDSFLVVKAHSYAVKTFYIDINNADSIVLKKWYEKVKDTTKNVFCTVVLKAENKNIRYVDTVLSVRK